MLITSSFFISSLRDNISSFVNPEAVLLPINGKYSIVVNMKAHIDIHRINIGIKIFGKNLITLICSERGAKIKENMNNIPSTYIIAID